MIKTPALPGSTVVTLVSSGIALVVVLTLAVTVLAYPKLPDPLPSHGNLEGEVDGYLPKLWGVVIVPLVTVLFTALLFLLPRIDPLKENYPEFRRQYKGFILVFAATSSLSSSGSSSGGWDTRSAPPFSSLPSSGRSSSISGS